MYDFPDSDESTSASASISRPASSISGRGTKARSNRSRAASTDQVYGSPTTKPKVDKKRKHAKAFDTDALLKRPQEATERVTPRSTNRLPPHQHIRQSPSKKPPNVSQTTREVPLRKKPEATKPPKLARSEIPSRSDKAPLKSPSPPGPTKTSPERSSRSRRPRLIDRLAAQRTEESDSSADSESDAGSDPGNKGVEKGPDTYGIDVSVTSFETPLSKKAVRGGDVWARPAPGQPGLASSKKIRHTYSQARSIRGETQSRENPFGLSGDLHDESLASSPPAKPSADSFGFPADDFDLDDDEEDGDTKITIKSVHELRRAGANNRFADEMEDLLSRIGTPDRHNKSMRRGALLELAQKLQREDFACQFRDHAARDNIAKSIQEEEDIVGGFAIAASLIEFLTSHHAPHLIRRLVEENVGKLIDRLLSNSEDVVAIARQRSTNVSKMGRIALGNIKSTLIQLPIWHGHKVDGLSPQMAGLQLLLILLRNLEGRYRAAVIADAEPQLSFIIKDYAETAADINANNALVLLILERESEADTSSPTVGHGGDRALAGAHFFERTLTSWPNQRGELESASLKLAINTTNAQRGAQAFSREILLRHLVTCISEGLFQVQTAVDNSALDTNMYDGLLLMLGVMINIVEHCATARTLLDNPSLDRLAGLYFDYRKSVGDVSNWKLMACTREYLLTY